MITPEEAEILVKHHLKTLIDFDLHCAEGGGIGGSDFRIIRQANERIDALIEAGFITVEQVHAIAEPMYAQRDRDIAEIQPLMDALAAAAQAGRQLSENSATVDRNFISHGNLLRFPKDNSGEAGTVSRNSK